MITNPVAAPDIDMFSAYGDDSNKFLLGSRRKDRYILVTREMGEFYLSLLHDLNGEYSMEQLSMRWGMSLEQTRELVGAFYEKGLLDNSPESSKNTEVNRLSKRIFSISCRHLNRISQRTAGRICVCFISILAAGILFDAAMFLTGKIGELNIFEFHNSYILSMVLSSLIMIPSFFFHEMCHCIVALKYGQKPSRIDICLYMMIFPLYYVKINGLYTVERRRRIWIMSAGILGNLFLGTVSFVLYIWFRHGIFLTIMLSQINIILANLNPFSLSDGYYIFSMIFKTENLRKKMFDIIANLNVKKYKHSDPVFFYILFNFLVIAVNVMYVSRFSYGVLCELLQLTLPGKVVPLCNIALYLVYLTIIHCRFREPEQNRKMKP